MIVKGFIVRNCTIQVGESFASIVKEGVVSEDGSTLVFEGFIFNVPGIEADMEVQDLLVDWSKDKGYYVELDRGGERHNDEDDGEAWKRG